jgi:hypothetical protein
MKTQSWYEPEKDRIVIIDLDDSDEEASSVDSTPTFDAAGITISSALLDHIKTQQSFPVSLTNDVPSTALVLFRPPLIRSREGGDQESKEQELILPAASPQDDDAMDIEP